MVLGQLEMAEKSINCTSESNPGRCETLTHQALYIVIRYELAEGSEEKNIQECEGSCLQNVCCSLPPQQEKLLSSFLIRRLKKGAIYIRTGAFSGMTFSVGGNSPAICYYVLLPNEYLVCLLTVAEANLEVFRPELARFCEDLEPHITDADIDNHLAKWYTVCVEYVNHVLEILGLDVSALLQLVQHNGSIKATSETPSHIKADIHQFLAACSVAECLVGAAPGVDATLAAADISGKYCVRDVEVNGYCTEWGRLLMELGPQAEPWRLRKLLEAFKLKTIKDMNMLKRLLKQAETDHYFLYRAYSFLLQSGNSDVLLRQAALEGGSSSEVLSVLEEHLANCSPTPTSTRV